MFLVVVQRWCCLGIGTYHDWCLQALADVAYLWVIPLSWSTQALVDIALCCTKKMSPSQCTHAMTVVCRSLLMLYLIDQCCIPDMHIPCLLQDNIGWCCLSLIEVTNPHCTSIASWYLSLANVDVAQQFQTHHELCVHALDDVTYLWWCNMSLSDFTYHVHTPQLMHIGLGQFFLLLFNVPFPTHID